jgi:hypothetical protein
MRSFKGRIAGQIAANSYSIAEICGDVAVYLRLKVQVHE